MMYIYYFKNTTQGAAKEPGNGCKIALIFLIFPLLSLEYEAHLPICIFPVQNIFVER